MKVDLFEEGLMERPLAGLGMSIKNYKEFSKANMKDFNDFA